MTDISRRNLLKSGAAIAGVAAAGVSAAMPVFAQGSTLVQGIAGSATLGAAFEHPFLWRMSLDGGETYHEEFFSYDDAKAAALKQPEGAVIAECQAQDFNLRVDGESVYEMLMGQNDEIIGEGDFLDGLNDENLSDLGNVVTAAIAAWAERHGINTTAWVFAHVRNEEAFPAREELAAEIPPA